MKYLLTSMLLGSVNILEPNTTTHITPAAQKSFTEAYIPDIAHSQKSFTEAYIPDIAHSESEVANVLELIPTVEEMKLYLTYLESIEENSLITLIMEIMEKSSIEYFQEEFNDDFRGIALSGFINNMKHVLDSIPSNMNDSLVASRIRVNLLKIFNQFYGDISYEAKSKIKSIIKELTPEELITFYTEVSSSAIGFLVMDMMPASTLVEVLRNTDPNSLPIILYNDLVTYRYFKQIKTSKYSDNSLYVEKIFERPELYSVKTKYQKQKSTQKPIMKQDFLESDEGSYRDLLDEIEDSLKRRSTLII